MNQKKDWRNRTDAGLVKGSLGIYENQEEILACPDNHYAAVARYSDRTVARFGCRAIHLYLILNRWPGKKGVGDK